MVFAQISWDKPILAKCQVSGRSDSFNPVKKSFQSLRRLQIFPPSIGYGKDSARHPMNFGKNSKEFIICGFLISTFSLIIFSVFDFPVDIFRIEPVIAAGTLKIRAQKFYLTTCKLVLLYCSQQFLESLGQPNCLEDFSTASSQEQKLKKQDLIRIEYLLNRPSIFLLYQYLPSICLKKKFHP